MGRKPASIKFSQHPIAVRLLQLAEKVGGLTGLAREAGVSNSSLTRCLKGGDPSVVTARAICAATGTSLDWFLNGEDNELSTRSQDRLRIPVFSAEASAGPGLVPPDAEEADQFLFFPRSALSFQNAGSADLFAIHARGDSMEPTIRNGSLLIANRGDQQPREGIYVVRRGESLLVKRTQPRENHILNLKSDNKQYDEEEIDLKQPDHGIRILGRVIWIGHSI